MTENTSIRFHSSQIPLFKSLCIHLSDHIAKHGYPKFKGRKLYDACSQTLGYKNFNALQHATNQRPDFTDEEIALDISRAVSQKIQEFYPFDISKVELDRAATAAGIKMQSEYKLSIPSPKWDLRGHKIDEAIDFELGIDRSSPPIYLSCLYVPRVLFDALKANPTFIALTDHLKEIYPDQFMTMEVREPKRDFSSKSRIVEVIHWINPIEMDKFNPEHRRCIDGHIDLYDEKYTGDVKEIGDQLHTWIKQFPFKDIIQMCVPRKPGGISLPIKFEEEIKRPLEELRAAVQPEDRSVFDACAQLSKYFKE